MNGRMYDPVLGRMLSPDNYVQAPGYTQSYNRYAYCFNNPLKYTDPTGNWAAWDDIIVGGAGFAYGYVSYGIKNNDWGWKAVGNGVLNSGIFLLGYYTGGAASPAALNTAFTNLGAGYINTVALGYTGRMLASSVISDLMPSASVNVGNFTFSVSPSYLIGSGGSSVGLNGLIMYSGSGYSIGIAGGLSYGTDIYTGLAGYEGRLSGFGSVYGDDFGVGFSTTQYWSGSTSQRLGRLNLMFGENWSFSYENDGWPFHKIGLGGGTDSYRTASIGIQYNDGKNSFELGMLLFSGYRDMDLRGFPKEGYPYGVVENPEIGRYNAGIFYLGYNGYRAGWNHDYIRHVFQNKFAHTIKPQNWIPRQNWPNRPYFVKARRNPFTNY